MSEFRGSFTVMVTPFRDDGRGIDEAATRRFVDWQIREGVPGLIPLGSTGEFLSITDDERTHLIEVVIDQARGRIPVIVGTAAEWTDEAVRYSREAERLGAAGVMVVPPFYSAPSEDELFEHYRRIGEAISIPIMVYNNPNTSNTDLRPALVARLGELDAVRYIKESSGDISRVREIARLTEGGVVCFAGYHPYDSMLLGADGYVSVCGNIVPGMSAELYDRTVTMGDHEGGRALFHRLLPLLDAIAGDLYVSATKAAMAMAGMPVGDPRPPRLPLPAGPQAVLRDVLKDLGVFTAREA